MTSLPLDNRSASRLFETGPTPEPANDLLQQAAPVDNPNFVDHLLDPSHSFSRSQVANHPDSTEPDSGSAIVSNEHAPSKPGEGSPDARLEDETEAHENEHSDTVKDSAPEDSAEEDTSPTIDPATVANLADEPTNPDALALNREAPLNLDRAPETKSVDEVHSSSAEEADQLQRVQSDRTQNRSDTTEKTSPGESAPDQTEPALAAGELRSREKERNSTVVESSRSDTDPQEIESLPPALQDDNLPANGSPSEPGRSPQVAEAKAAIQTEGVTAKQNALPQPSINVELQLDSQGSGSGGDTQDGANQAPESSDSTLTSGMTKNTTTARFAQHLTSQTTPSTSAGSTLSGAEGRRFINRVAMAFEAAQSGDGHIRIRLSPPELGSLRIELRLEGANLIAKVEAETAAARSVLVENLSTLRERLSEHGVSIESFEVDLSSQQRSELPDGEHQSAQGDRGHDERRTNLEATEERESESHQLPETHNGQINVII